MSGFGYMPGFVPGVPLMREELIEHANTSVGLVFDQDLFLGEPSEIVIIVVGLAFLLVGQIVAGQTTFRDEKWFFIF